MVTFNADKVSRSTQLLTTVPAKEYMETLLSKPAKMQRVEGKWVDVQPPKRILEAASGTDVLVVNGQPINSFVSAALTAYRAHYPFVFTPDAFWITITQGLANHVTCNAEALRNKFVAHEGKELISVDRPGFVRGSGSNEWPGVFSEFSEKIKTHIGPAIHSNIVADFSTTGPTERAASEVVLMDAMKSYFSYEVRTMCGIPEFTIEGTVDDWRLMKDRISSWTEYGLTTWVTALNTILDEIIATFNGTANLSFWSSFFKESGSSGGPYVSGWINWLFPYFKGYKVDLAENKNIGNLKGHITTDHYPSSLCKTPFVWTFPDAKFDYDFIAGGTGFVQLENLAVKPIVGWGIGEQVK